MKINGLQLVANPKLVNKAQTTANLQIGKLTEKEIAIPIDKPWEGGNICYPNTFWDNDKYRLYYLAWIKGQPIQSIRVCYAESKDGLTWVKPELGICTFEGSTANNIILDKTSKPNPQDFFDNFFVFKDENPKCKKNEKYKALAYTDYYRLECYFSADGIHFEKGPTFDLEGKFDTLNTCRWDKKKKKYIAYVRDFHDVKNPEDLNSGIRDIRVTESKDFRNWSKPELLVYEDMKEDYPLYTNNVMQYPRNPDLLIGFPTRYIERKEWTDNFEELCGKEERRERMKTHPRMGLAITDCLFMMSEDGKKWHRFEKAFITPGLESGGNWVYGDCYPAYALLDSGNNFSMLMSKTNDIKTADEFKRFEIRKDGFCYYEANENEKKLVLKKLTYTGKDMYINFSTSAAGYMYVEMEDSEGNVIKSCELFGDSIERKVSFEKGAVEKFSGKSVKITFRLKDAQIYSMLFK